MLVSSVILKNIVAYRAMSEYIFGVYFTTIEPSLRLRQGQLHRKKVSSNVLTSLA